jgi:transposase
VIFYQLLKRPVEYQDLGADYFDHLNPDRLRRYLVKRLEGLGYQVIVTPQEDVA